MNRRELPRTASENATRDTKPKRIQSDVTVKKSCQPLEQAETAPQPSSHDPSLQADPAKRRQKRWIERISSTTIDPRLSPKLQEYDEIRRLGHGSYGEVFEVADATDTHYALKILSKKLMARENKTRFLQIESQSQRKLRESPNIVKLLRAFQDRENCYLVLELAENGGLDVVLQKYVALARESAVIILAQILVGICYMHSNGVLHRDLKPSNVLLNKDNVAKISDFGTAKLFSNLAELKGVPGSFVGSPDYVSPEIATCSEIGPECDLWSFGCIVYTLFAGRPPFYTKSGSQYATFQKIVHGELEMADYVPEDVRDLVSKLLRKEPKERLGHDECFEEENLCYLSIKSHPLFAGIDWETVGTLPPPPFASFEPAFEVFKKEEREQEKTAKIGGDQEVTVSEALITLESADGAKEASIVVTNKGRVVIQDVDGDEVWASFSLDNCSLDLEGREVTICSGEEVYRAKLDEEGTWESKMPEFFA